MDALFLACSGPGAMRVIEGNIAYAQHQAVIAGVGTLVAGALWFFTGRLKAFAVAVGVLLALHPAWTMSAMHGDCGYTKATAATVVSVVVGLCALTQVGLLIARRPGHDS